MGNTFEHIIAAHKYVQGGQAMPNQGSIHTCTATIYEMLLPGMSKGQGRTDKDAAADGRAWMGVE